jgi:hypothetical protein
MRSDYDWNRALADILASAHYGEVPLCYIWSAVIDASSDESQISDEELMERTLRLLKHCLEEGYLVAGETFPLGPLPPEPPPGLSLVEQLRWESAYCGDQGPKFDWRPWDMGYSEALKKIAREWKAIEKPFSDPTAMYCIVTLVPTLKAMREYERLRKQLKLDEEKEDED